MSFDSTAKVQGSPTRGEETRIPRLTTPPPFAAKAAAAVIEPLSSVGEQFDPRRAFIASPATEAVPVSRIAPTSLPASAAIIAPAPMSAYAPAAAQASVPMPASTVPAPDTAGPEQTFTNEKTNKPFKCSLANTYFREWKILRAVIPHINEEVVHYCKMQNVDWLHLYGEEDWSLEQIQLLKRFKGVTVVYPGSKIEDMLVALLTDNFCTTHIELDGEKHRVENLAKLVQAIEANQTVRNLNLWTFTFQNDEEARELFSCQNSNLVIENPNFAKFTKPQSATP